MSGTNLSSRNNNRIAKNTMVLYGRTMFTMFVALFTSRIILNALGVDNYGIYNVVAGFVSMMSVLSGSLSSSISRYITVAIGKEDKTRLEATFSTSLFIQLLISAIVIIVAETIGLWFINTHMNIPEGRMYATNWVYQCSITIFIINILYVPFNACIIAHEKMTAFAYVSIADVILKLLIALSIKFSSFDKLIFYSSLLVAQSIIIASIYIIYCNRNFSECHLKITRDKSLMKDMSSFAGWAFLTGGTAVINTQGLNILINVFFGVALNAARGIATQIESVIMKFVNDFTTAINPQIIKNYAKGDIPVLQTLIYRGAKFSYFLLLFFALPIIFETEIILKIWLGIIPEHTVSFFRLTMIASMINVLGNTSVTACMASGNIKQYTITLTAIGLCVFPFTWIAFQLGFPVESCYIVYITIYTIILFVRLYLMRKLVNIPILPFYIQVLIPAITTTIASLIFPLLIRIYTSHFYSAFINLISCSVACFLSTAICVYTIGLNSSERTFIKERLLKIIKIKK